MRQALRGTKAGLVCGLALMASVPAEAQTKEWSIQLATVGWQDPYVEMEARFQKVAEAKRSKDAAPAKSGEGSEPANGAENPARSFLDDLRAAPAAGSYDADIGVIWRDELVVDASGQVMVGFAAKRAGLSAPKALRVVTLNAQNGSMVRQLEMPTPTWDRTAMMLAGDGALLVVAGDQVQRVRNDGSIGSSIPIPPQPEINPGLWVEQSPSGRTLMLTTDEKNFQFVRTDTLATVSACHNDTDEVHTVTDDRAVSMGEDENHQFELRYGPLCGPMGLLWSLPYGRSNRLHLLEDGSVLEIGINQVRRLTTGDKTVWSWKVPESLTAEDLDGFSVSRTGERVAFQLTAFRTLHSPSCMECKGPPFESWIVGIVVLDAKSGGLVAIVPVDHGVLNRMAFALSPDGQKLAVMHDGVLELWAL
jgi:hypothetical protein